jgi:hypothetical protein
MLKQEELAFVKTVSTLHLSPAFFKELRTVLSSRKSGRWWCLPEAAAQRSEIGPKTFSVLKASTRASAKPTC